MVRKKNNKRRPEEEDIPTASFSGSVKGPGGQIGPFRIEQELGRGAVGVVYLAHDTKLDRSVAIKSLPAEVMANPKARSRFSREARLLASLNHPNIATIYEELQEAEGVGYLILEYVPGQTLAERIAKSGFKLQESLSIALQIAEAVAAAHEHGVIHRDLKPGNIKITPEGKVKVLDFGLAKAVGGEAADQQSTVTEPGRVIGTPAYMSPEQARGQAADKRSDIWSFGCVLYEMLTATIPFRGETISDTLANILQTDPNWQALPPTTPANIRSLLRHCLEKDPRRRLRDIGDAGIEISETLSLPATAAPITPIEGGPSRPALWKGVILAGLIGLVVGAIVMVVVFRDSISPSVQTLHSALKRIKRFTISLPATKPMASPQPGGNTLALSPDGTRLVYVADIAGTRQLVMHRFDRLDSQPIPGTESAISPFFSPDGQWVGFFTGASGPLKKVSVQGGLPVTLCPIQDLVALGATWGDDDFVVFPSRFNSGLSRVSAGGGTPEALPTGETRAAWYAFPEILPGAEAVLFDITEAIGSEAQIVVLSLETGEQKIVAERASRPRYVPTGHVVYEQQGTLMAAPFDIDRLETTGPPVPVAESRMVGSDRLPIQFAFSTDGSLIYAPGAAGVEERRRLVWVDRKGVVEPLQFPADAYSTPRLSPDSRRLALQIVRDQIDVWILDLDRGTRSRFTFDPAFDGNTLWRPDGGRVAFASTRDVSVNIFWRPADGSGPAEQITRSENGLWPHSWSPDGQILAFAEVKPDGNIDIGLLSLEGEPTTRVLLDSPSSEDYPAISPDGRWIAYTSDETGRNEVYIQPFPNLGGKWPVSTEGGDQPIWSPDGRELFYHNGQAMMAVAIETEPSLTVGKPEILFEGPYVFSRSRDYDISPDGQRFLMIKESEEIEETSARTELIVVENWFEELKRRAPPGKD
ncbi:MAG: protein kinase domain-containing protein [Planctomycetota bacterium]|jgi:serine/threonine-protein kinase